jgi:flagellar biosynthesis GTPase FlhF
MVLSKNARIQLAGLLLGTAVAFPAAAKVTCCEVDGKRTCGDPPPPQCLSKARTVFDKGGVAKEVEAPLTAEQRAAIEAEKVRKVEEDKRAAEQARRDRALLDSYTNEKEVDAARDRALADLEKNAEQARNRLDAAMKKKQKLEQEKEFYQKKPMPAALAAQLKDNENEIAAQQKILEQKDADVAAVKERYATDKARYLQLRGKGATK